MKKSFGAKTLAYPAPVFIVGTYDREGKPNAMNAAWGCLSSSQPPCVSVSIRSATYTHGCIMERKAFTVNIPSEQYAKEADFFGVASGRNVDKFAKAGLTAVKSTLVDAPYIEEFPLILECKLINTVEIGIHTQFTGEILDVKVDENVVENDRIVLSAIAPMIYAPGVNRYYGLGREIGKAFTLGKEIQG